MFIRDYQSRSSCSQHVLCFLSDGHSLTFSGSGYVKYHLMENENKELMRLSLKLRTFSSHATVMYAKGTDYSILEVCMCVCVHPN